VDSERCFADDLAGVAETVRLAIEAGLAGWAILLDPDACPESLPAASEAFTANA